ncbi:MAG: TorF family putative porin [Hyphomicrobiaceae bacterium]|nr:TorF family putative porin [Hyphomicrobiaceae bacterium]
MSKLLSGLVVAAALAAGSTGALADEPPKFGWSFNIAGTTDYVFRGISQTSEDPTVQAAVDFSYGMFYTGVWASGLDFGNDFAANPNKIATVEIDV